MHPTPSNKNTSLALALGKVIIAAAWADGTIQEQEVECLKDLLYQLPDLEPKEAATLQKLLKQPIGKTETELFLDELLDQLSNEEEQKFALYALKRVISADGQITQTEETFIQSVRDEIERKKNSSLFSQLKSFLQKPIRVRLSAVTESTQDEGLNAFLKNKMAELRGHDVAPHVVLKKEMHKLCLAGALLSKVIWADGRVNDREVETVNKFLQKKWSLSEQDASFVTRISLDASIHTLDTIRICRELYELTSSEERVQFLDILFDIAYADGTLSNKEVDEIIEITANLKLEQVDFHNALMRYTAAKAKVS